MYYLLHIADCTSELSFVLEIVKNKITFGLYYLIPTYH